MAALVLDLIYDVQWRDHPASKKQEAGGASPPLNVRVFLGVSAAFAAAYGVWNSVLSGTVLPNTYAAKLTYYGSGSSDFGAELLRFLTDGHLMPFVLLAGVGALNVVVRILRRKPQAYLVHLLWILALTSAYWLKLPHLYQEGRYLMPLLPFVLMLGVDGLESVLARLESAFHLLKRNSWRVAVTTACGGALVIQFVAADMTKSRGYAGACKYIEDRQVTTARWISSHLPEDAIVATHDVGAVAFYGGRRIADMVGLVSPGYDQEYRQLRRPAAFSSFAEGDTCCRFAKLVRSRESDPALPDG